MSKQPETEMRAYDDIDVRKRVLTDCLQASARLYMYFARQVLDASDTHGEAVVRDSIRKYGQWRGSEMRQAHAALGEAINVKTLLTRWDSASTYVAKDEISDQGSYAPNDVSFNVSYCPASLAWKEADFHRWGHVYCDEFHQSAATAYHPDAVVVIPINMMKGDHHCAFRWVMPNLQPRDEQPAAPEEITDLGRRIAPLYEIADDEVTNMRLALTRTNRLLAGRYMTFMQALTERLGADSALAVATEALRTWATDRGRRLARRLTRAASGPLTADAVWRQTDLAPEFTWTAHLVEGTDALLEADVAGTPLDDLWQHYGTHDWARLFWTQSLSASFGALYQGATVEVTTAPETGRLTHLTVRQAT